MEALSEALTKMTYTCESHTARLAAADAEAVSLKATLYDLRRAIADNDSAVTAATSRAEAAEAALAAASATAAAATAASAANTTPLVSAQ